jgi:hypothetical protein
MKSRPHLARLIVPLAALACVFSAPAVAMAQPASPAAHLATSQTMHPDDSWWCGPGNGAGSLCDGTDPVATGCSKDASYIASADGYFQYQRGGPLSKRQVGWWYSWSCNTAWATLLWLDQGPSYCSGCTLTLNTPTRQSVGSDGTTLFSGAYTKQYFLTLCADSTANFQSSYAWVGFWSLPYNLC